MDFDVELAQDYDCHSIEPNIFGTFPNRIISQWSGKCHIV